MQNTEINERDSEGYRGKLDMGARGTPASLCAVTENEPQRNEEEMDST